MVNFLQELMESKYHLSVAKRMYSSYQSFPEKRFLVGTINELAKASSRIVRAYLANFNKKNIEDFKKDISGKYLGEKTSIELVKVLEIEKAQKTTPVQFDRDGKIIMLVDGKYKILTKERLGELLLSVEDAIKEFSKVSRQV